MFIAPTVMTKLFCRSLVLALCAVEASALFAAPTDFYVSPTGNDAAVGTQAAPFRTIARAQEAVRAVAAGMQRDLVVHLAAGEYRLQQPLAFTAADSGRHGFRVVYRSDAGPGQTRLLGSQVLQGWQPYRDGIWQIAVPPGTVFHTLYENGRRAHKARFPDLDFDPTKPTAAGRYLVTLDGNPKQTDKTVKRPEGQGWLTYASEFTPPADRITKMRLHIYAGGKCDWVREIHRVVSIDPVQHKITFDRVPVFGVGQGARFFLEDELALLNAPGEFFLDEAAHTLYYKPLASANPDTLNITYPVAARLLQLQGASRNACVQNLVFDGLALEETDNSPPMPLWAHDGLRDNALVWMNNTAQIEIRNCHLKNSGRSGVMIIGHNVSNLVAGCWIEHLGVNGVSLCNKFTAPGGKAPTADRCEQNRVHNCRISYVGELHCYAECITAFNVSSNEVDHCQLDNSVRYAVTIRGNTGAQYGPPVWTPHPPAMGNYFHHLRVFRCGQDSGDMGALHAANLNNPDGPAINTFEQITVADTAAIESMKDIPPDGIFLDWPKMSMHQVFRNLHIVRSAGRPLRSNRSENEASATLENVSWKPGFREEAMDYEHIGLTSEFPAAFGGRPPLPPPPPAPEGVNARATAHDTIILEWAPSQSPNGEPIYYVVTRDGARLEAVSQPRFEDRCLKENTAYHYRVAARCGDFSRFGSASKEIEVRTLADKTPPALTGVRLQADGQRARVSFSKPIEPAGATVPANYHFTPPLAVKSAKAISSSCVELTLAPFKPGATFRLTVSGVTDSTAAKNPIDAKKSVVTGQSEIVVQYPMNRVEQNHLLDLSNSGGDALLHGGASIEASAGPNGRPALVLDGSTGFAEAPPDLNLGEKDFTIMAWIYRENNGVILSKGTDFNRPNEWSWGWTEGGQPKSLCLRVNNHYFSSAAGSVPDREWVHVAFVKKGKQGQAYVNGKPSGKLHDLSVLQPLVNDRLLRIGRREHEPAPAYFKGRLADLAVFTLALTPEQIQAKMQP